MRQAIFNTPSMVEDNWLRRQPARL